MTKNMSNLDRIIRTVIVAPAAIVAAILLGAGSIGGIVLLAVAAVMLATSAYGFCPLYAALGIHTQRGRALPHG
jgi:hypothetical protein